MGAAASKASDADYPAHWFEDAKAEASAEQLAAIEAIAKLDPAAFLADANAARADLTPELFELSTFRPMCVRHSERSAAIASLVYKVVPKKATEAEFWRIYWCHVYSALVRAGLKPSAPYIDLEVLRRGDDTTTNAIIRIFQKHPAFVDLATREMNGIIERDAQDDEKLAAGIKVAIAKGVVEANPPVEPVTKIDVYGKTADQVADQIIAGLGDKAQSGCVVVLQGLSGTGKGTTVDRVKSKLPAAVTWSNGNIFRALTLLSLKKCEEVGIKPDESGKYDLTSVLTADNLNSFVKMLDFGWYNEQWDIRIKGFDLDVFVSQEANTLLKEPRIGKHIPTVAENTQGEVIGFAAAAATKMGAGGTVVLMEGRAPTLEYVRTPFRFELVMSDPVVIGMRRGAQRMMGAAVNKLKELDEADEPTVSVTLHIVLTSDEFK